jgi:hypothetical protein
MSASSKRASQPATIRSCVLCDQLNALSPAQLASSGRSQILIQPVERRFNEIISLGQVTRVKQSMMFVPARRAQKPKQWYLARVQGCVEIVFAVDHQNGDRYSRGKVERVYFGSHLLAVQSSSYQYRDFPAAWVQS